MKDIKQRAEEKYPLLKRGEYSDETVGTYNSWQLKQREAYIAGATEQIKIFNEENHQSDNWHPNGQFKGEQAGEGLLLDFCHFLGDNGYKINGWDDGMLNIIIDRFSQQPSTKSLT